MTRDQLYLLFLGALEKAAVNADSKLPTPAPRSFWIELHGVGDQIQSMDVGEAFQRVYLGDDCFYAMIDIAIKVVSADKSLVFMNVSSRRPVGFKSTWDPENFGPFKPLLPDSIEERAVL